jgi:hypothetical protein
MSAVGCGRQQHDRGQELILEKFGLDEAQTGAEGGVERSPGVEQADDARLAGETAPRFHDEVSDGRHDPAVGLPSHVRHRVEPAEVDA